MPWYQYLIYAIIGIAAFSLLMFLFNITPPKFKTAGDPTDFGIEYEAVRFKTKDGLVLAGWLVHGNKNSPTIIVGHGYPFDKGNIFPVVRFLHPDYTLFLFDFRSFGDSEGMVTTAGAREIEDLNAAIRYLKKREDVSHTFGAYGFSLSAATFLMAENPEIKAIVADSSYASIHDIIQQMYWYFGPFKWPFVWITELYGRIFLGIDAKKYNARVTVSTLLIHGSADSQIPVYNSYKIYETNKKLAELLIVEGADHGMSHEINPKEYKARVREFFNKHL